MSKTKESILEEQVEKFMKSKGIWQLARYQAQSNQNGLPDRIYLYKGYLLGLELKTDEGAPTKLQLKKIDEINYNGGIGLIIRDVKVVEQLIKLIDAYKSYTITLNDSILECLKEWMEDNGYKGIDE